MNTGEHTEPETIVATYQKNNGSIRATAIELGIARRTVQRHIIAAGLGKKPLVAKGRIKVKAEVVELPSEGRVKRFLLTSAQNNTKVHEKFWENLLALAKFYKARIMVGTYSYNQNAYGPMSVKRGTSKAGSDEQRTLWYDPCLKPDAGDDSYIVDHPVDLGEGLRWCGEYNALPTAVNPLAGLEPYAARKSAIFPHAKMAMRSIATMADAAAKLIFTTGTVTKMSYIQKRAGTIAEHHHVFGALLVEVNDKGHWWVRQINAEAQGGKIQDLDVVVDDGKVTTGNRVEAITWGDLHSTWIDKGVHAISLEMLDALKPKYQFFHDILKGWVVNPHAQKRPEPHYSFHMWLQGFNRFENELDKTIEILNSYDREGCQSISVDSNHDDPWIQRWLREYDYRKDPPNAEFFLRAQSYMYAQLRSGKMARDVSMLEWSLRDRGYAKATRFLIADESFLICNRRIECGMHGYLGPNGRIGAPENLSKLGRRANIAHTHSAGIYDGLYVAGTSSKLRWTYNRGPSSWSHSHIVTYPNGKRTIITIYGGAWRA